MSPDQKTELVTAASTLFENIKADIKNASTRIEHIRLTALAQEAANLLNKISEVDTAAANMYTGGAAIAADPLLTNEATYETLPKASDSRS